MTRAFSSASATARPMSTARRSPASSIAPGSRVTSRAGSSPNSATPRSPPSPPSSTRSTPRTARRSASLPSEVAVARADRAFGILIGLALVSSAILIALLLTLVPRAEQLLARGAEEPADVVAALVLALATCGISLGVFALFRQLAATAVLIRSLVARKIALPASVAQAARGLELDQRIDVVADERPFSFCYWFLRPRICLSTALVARLDGEELRAVLLHERYHLQHRDPLRIVVARYFAAGLYVVPVVDELVGFYALQKEIAADEYAVSRDGVGALASALYKLLPDADDVSLGLL